MPNTYIDVHMHCFNSRSIPIAGVARKYGGVARSAAWLMDRLYTGLTRDDGSLEGDGSWDVQATGSDRADVPLPPDKELTPEEAIQRFVKDLGDDWFRSGEFHTVRRDIEGTDPFSPDADAARAPESVHERRRWLIDYLRGNSAGGAHGDGPSLGRRVGGMLQFFYALTRSEKDLADRLSDYSPGVGLLVHHMMDMELPFEDEPVYPYRQAIVRTRQLCRQSAERPGGPIIAFVAFDGYRADTAELVEDALLNRSFVGVKLYAPCGYRPDTNAAATHAWLLDPADIAALDARCRSLIRLCADRDIPIMAHCTPGGMEVAPKGDPHPSGWNANPGFWEDTLHRYPRLRLCFGHAGGSGRWLPPEAQPHPPAYPWVDKIVELCRTYENVYLDLSHKEELLHPATAAQFARALSADLAVGPTPDRPYRLANKIMYGSDYPMPLPSNGWPRYWTKVFDLFRDHLDLRPYTEAVFRANAVAYLNLDRFLRDRGNDMTPQQRIALEPFR